MHVGPNPGQIPTPFKRYHLGTVWRGESPQAGRYREFMQCDFDIIGTTSNGADIEIALVIHDLMVALGFERFMVRVNNRMVLNGLLEELGLRERADALLRALDKLPKIGRDKVREEMCETGEFKAGVIAEQADRVINLAETKGTNAEILDKLVERCGKNALAAEGIARLRELLTVWSSAGLPQDRIAIDVSICRGLDYYTGTIYETFLTDLPAIGSVCSGGRYDNLTSLYTKTALPGVGASLGLDRLLAAMEELNLLQKVGTPAPVLVVQFAAERLGDYQRVARELRSAGVACEVYPEAKKIGQQLQYAEKRGFRLAVIAGPEEFTRGEFKVKDLAKREERTVAAGGLVAAVKGMLA
jgi:histidyl-tRNA synthetase